MGWRASTQWLVGRGGDSSSRGLVGCCKEREKRERRWLWCEKECLYLMRFDDELDVETTKLRLGNGGRLVARVIVGDLCAPMTLW
jgi:hypothetical protein